MSPEVSILKQATEHYNEPDWLDANADSLHETLSKSFKNATVPGEATNTFLMVYPYAIQTGEVKRWSKLLQDALSLQNDFDATQDRIALQHKTPLANYLISESDKELNAEFKLAMRRARKRLKPGSILKAYLDIFKSQFLHQSEAFTPDAVQSAITLGRQVNLPECYAELYLALAYAYHGWGDYARAIDYAQLAYDYFVSNKDNLQAGISAYISAISYRLVADGAKNTEAHENALSWLDTASQHYSKVDKPEYQIGILNEKAAFLLLSGDLEASQQWYELALQEATAINHQLFTAIIRHGLGDVLAKRREHEGAWNLLDQADQHFESVGLQIRRAAVLYSKAFNDYLQNNKDGALMFLHPARDIVEGLPESKAKAELLKKINISINTLSS